MVREEMEAQQYVWKGAIPLQIHLHDSEVTTLPPPPPLIVLAPRIGYLTLLISSIRPHFSSALPPGVDTVWFDYKGLPLKCTLLGAGFWNPYHSEINWMFDYVTVACRHIPTGVLFDLLCAEPERPWNLTVHFRGYPANVLLPCEGEDTIKWSFINSLKEAAYILSGHCKNVMNMSQPDQQDLWRSVLNGDLETYRQVSLKLKLGKFDDEYTINTKSLPFKSQPTTAETTAESESPGQVRTVRIPVRLYVRNVVGDFDDLEDAPPIDDWDQISYINRPVEIIKEEGKCFTLGDAIKCLLPELFTDSQVSTGEEAKDDTSETGISTTGGGEEESNENVVEKKAAKTTSGEIKLIQVHGIEPKLEIPFSWVVNNLMNPEYYLHISVYVRVSPA